MFDKEEKELKEYDGGNSGELFKFKEGKNRVRILAGGMPLAKHWVNGVPTVCYGMTKGCPLHGKNAPRDKDSKEIRPRVQHAFYVLDKAKKEPTIQLAYVPYTVFKAIKGYSEEEGYEFDSLPMPYDIAVTYDPNEQPANMYKVIAGVNRAEVPKEILEELAEKPTIESIVTSQKEHAKGTEALHTMKDDNEVVDEEAEITPENIPF